MSNIERVAIFFVGTIFTIVPFLEDMQAFYRLFPLTLYGALLLGIAFPLNTERKEDAHDY